jgi:hypothetical protein
MQGRENMDAVLQHLDQVSVFGRSPVALFFILGLDWAFTAVHDYEEWRGKKRLSGEFSGQLLEFGYLIGSGSYYSLSL